MCKWVFLSGGCWERRDSLFLRSWTIPGLPFLVPPRKMRWLAKGILTPEQDIQKDLVAVLTYLKCLLGKRSRPLADSQQLLAAGKLTGVESEPSTQLVNSGAVFLESGVLLPRKSPLGFYVFILYLPHFTKRFNGSNSFSVDSHDICRWTFCILLNNIMLHFMFLSKWMFRTLNNSNLKT